MARSFQAIAKKIKEPSEHEHLPTLMGTFNNTWYEIYAGLGGAVPDWVEKEFCITLECEITSGRLRIIRLVSSSLNHANTNEPQ